MPENTLTENEQFNLSVMNCCKIFYAEDITSAAITQTVQNCIADVEAPVAFDSSFPEAVEEFLTDVADAISRGQRGLENLKIMMDFAYAFAVKNGDIYPGRPAEGMASDVADLSGVAAPAISDEQLYSGGGPFARDGFIRVRNLAASVEAGSDKGVAVQMSDGESDIANAGFASGFALASQILGATAKLADEAEGYVGIGWDVVGTESDDLMNAVRAIRQLLGTVESAQ